MPLQLFPQKLMLVSSPRSSKTMYPRNVEVREECFPTVSPYKIQTDTSEFKTNVSTRYENGPVDHLRIMTA